MLRCLCLLDFLPTKDRSSLRMQQVRRQRRAAAADTYLRYLRLQQQHRRHDVSNSDTPTFIHEPPSTMCPISTAAHVIERQLLFEVQSEQWRYLHLPTRTDSSLLSLVTRYIELIRATSSPNCNAVTNTVQDTVTGILLAGVGVSIRSLLYFFA